MDNEQLPKGYKQTEVGLIPNDWEVRTLGNVGEVKMCRRIFNNETSSNGTIPFFKIGTFGKEPDAYISKEQYDEYRKRFSFPRKGDILISAAGTIGRTIIYNGEDAYFQDSNIVWIENDFETVSNEFLYHIYQVANYNTEGGTIQRLYNSILKATKFKCPPKAEQTAIATALSDADALINSLSTLIAKKRNIKQGAMQQLLKPKEGWEVKKLGDFLDYEQPTEYLVTDTEYNDNNQIPVLTAGKTFILGYTNEEHGIFKNLPVIIFDDFTTAIKYVDFPFKAKSSAMKMLLPKNEKANLRLIYEIMLQIKYQVADHKRHWIGEYSKIEIKVPSTPEEQNEIATILSDMDAEIQALESKLEKYRKIKLGMMQVLLTGKVRLV